VDRAGEISGMGAVWVYGTSKMAPIAWGASVVACGG